MRIATHHFLHFSHRLSYSTPSRYPTGKFHARAPARFALPFYLFFYLVVYASFSVALSHGEPSDDLSEAITPLNLKKKGALIPLETYDNIAHDKAPSPPPPLGSPSVYLEDMYVACLCDGLFC